MFGFLSEKIKLSENRDNFQRHKYILLTEAVRKHLRRASAMFTTPGDQVNLSINLSVPLVVLCPSVATVSFAVWTKFIQFALGSFYADCPHKRIIQ